MRSLVALYIILQVAAFGCSYDDGYLKKLYQIVQTDPRRYESTHRKIWYVPTPKEVTVPRGTISFFNAVKRHK